MNGPSNCGRIGSIICVTDENRAALVAALANLRASRRYILQRVEQKPWDAEFAGYRFTLSNEREFLELVQVLEERVVRGTGRTTATLKLVLECERRGEKVFYVINYEQILYVQNLYRYLGGNPNKVRFVTPRQLASSVRGIVARVAVDHHMADRRDSRQYRELDEMFEVARLANVRADSVLGAIG